MLFLWEVRWGGQEALWFHFLFPKTESKCYLRGLNVDCKNMRNVHSVQSIGWEMWRSIRFTGVQLGGPSSGGREGHWAAPQAGTSMGVVRSGPRRVCRGGAQGSQIEGVFHSQKVVALAQREYSLLIVSRGDQLSKRSHREKLLLTISTLSGYPAFVCLFFFSPG